MEAGLLYWSLRARATKVGVEMPLLPTPIVRAWATNIAWIQRTVETRPVGPGPGFGPTIAA